MITYNKAAVFVKKIFFCYLISDDTHDGTTSSVNNGPTEDDEWSGYKKRNGANASKHECTESGKNKCLEFHLIFFSDL